jgi:hypothetical protein
MAYPGDELLPDTADAKCVGKRNWNEFWLRVLFCGTHY